MTKLTEAQRARVIADLYGWDTYRPGDARAVVRRGPAGAWYAHRDAQRQREEAEEERRRQAARFQEHEHA